HLLRAWQHIDDVALLAERRAGHQYRRQVVGLGVIEERQLLGAGRRSIAALLQNLHQPLEANRESAGWHIAPQQLADELVVAAAARDGAAVAGRLDLEDIAR